MSQSALTKKDILLGFSLFASYLLGAELGLYLAIKELHFATFWPPAGIFLAYLIVIPYGKWPFVIICALSANIIFDFFLQGKPILTCLGFLIANSISGILGAIFIKKNFSHKTSFNPLISVRQFGKFIFTTFFTTLIGSLIGAAVVHFSFASSYLSTILVWWSGDLVGTYLLTPAIIFILTEKTWLKAHFFFRIREIFGISLVLVSLIAAHYLRVFDTHLWGIFILPLLLFTTVRLKPLQVSMVTFLVVITTVYFEVTNLGFLSRIIGDSDYFGFYIQGFLIAVMANYSLLSTALYNLKIENQLLKEEKIKALQASNAKHIFLANMSHEIRTPMNGVLGMIQLLKMENLPSDILEKINTIEKSGELLLRIVNDILDISKIESKKISLESIVFNLQKNIQDVADLLKNKASANGNTLIIECDQSLPQWVNGDPYRLSQVLINLASNGIKFCKNGRVTIRVAKQEKDLIEFAISDTGIGIPEDKLPLMFQRFSQLDESTTRKFGGTGLGLSISHSLVELFGGKISVTSKVGVGTTFRFAINLPEDKAPTIKTESKKNRDIDISNYKVLVAEDNKINQEIVGSFLKKLGIKPIIVTNGLDAVKACQEEKFDLVFMDCHMPIMDGLEATRTIKALDHKDYHIPFVIALTASTMIEEMERCSAAGMDDFIAKPLKFDLVCEKIKIWANS